MSYVEQLDKVMQPIFYKGIAIEPSNGKYLVFGVPHDSLLLARLTIENSFVVLGNSLSISEDE